MFRAFRRIVRGIFLSVVNMRSRTRNWRRPCEGGKFSMRSKYCRINFTVLTGIITILFPLMFVSCSTTSRHKIYDLIPFVDNTPWYNAYEINSRDQLLSIGSVPVLIQALEDEKASVRMEASKALAEIGPDARDALPALTEALNDEAYDVRQAAADALEAIALNFITEKNGDVESEEVDIEKDDEETLRIRILVNSARLEAKNWLIKKEAVNKLVDLGQDTAIALPALAQVLEDRSDWHRHYDDIIKDAVTVLGNIGPEAQTANPALLKTMENRDYDVRLEVVKAMGKIGPKSDAVIIETLIQALKYDADFDVRREAAVSLGGFESHAVSAVPALLDVSQTDTDYNVRRAAVNALCRIEPGGDSTMCALEKAIVDKDADARRSAVIALRDARPEDRETWLPRIISCLDDINEGVRSEAVKTLAKYEINSDMVCKALNRVAQEDKSLEVKKAALETLIDFKKGEAEALKMEKGQGADSSSEAFPSSDEDAVF